MAREVVGRLLLSAVLVAAASGPTLARGPADETDSISLAEASVASLLHAVRRLPFVVWPDKPAPASVAEFVPAVRQQLWSQAIDGLRVPLHLRFLEARCRADGSAVALVFEEIGPPYGARTYAYAMRRGMPGSADDGWAGGYGLANAVEHPEFVRLMGRDSVSCP